jgi:transposase
MSDFNATTDPREQRGILIAATFRIVKKGAEWIVPSQSGNGSYRVNLDNHSCNCPDHETRHTRCKHIIAAEIVYQRELFPDGTVTETQAVTVTYAEPESKRPTYPQQWHEYNLAQTNEKSRFMVLLRDLCATVEQREQTMGRPRFPLADMVFSTTYKVYSGFSSRRFTTDIREAAYHGLIERAPHFNSVSNYLSAPELTPILKDLIEMSATPLSAVEVDFAVDSTGFATNTYSRWFDHKWGKERTRQTWVKTHLMCGVKTNVVTAVEATPFESGDSPQLPALLATTAETFGVREVSADKAYASRANHFAITAMGAQAFIPFQDRSTGMGSHKHGRDYAMDSIWQRAWAYYTFNRPDFLDHYHKRSNVESTMWMIKSKFGASVKSKSPEGQVNEVLCKVLAHNICVLISSFYELGIDSHFCTESLPAAQKVIALR